MNGGDILSNLKRYVQIKFRVTEEEKNMIEYKIKKTGYNKGRFLREIALNGEINIYKKDLNLDGIRKEIAKIGNNINQIARKANQVGGITRQDLKDLQKRIEDIWLHVRLYQ